MRQVAPGGAILDQHQRKIVAKPGEIPVPGEERRPHRLRVDRRETLAPECLPVKWKTSWSWNLAAMSIDTCL